MTQLIINQDATLRNYPEAFRCQISAPQWKYFETILMGLLRQVTVVVTMSGLSSFPDQSSVVSCRIGASALPAVSGPSPTAGDASPPGSKKQA